MMKGDDTKKQRLVIEYEKVKRGDMNETAEWNNLHQSGYFLNAFLSWWTFQNHWLSFKKSNWKILYCHSKDIAQNTNLSIHSVRTFINRLKEKKIITKHSQGIYELLIPIEKSKIVFNTPQSPIDDF